MSSTPIADDLGDAPFMIALDALIEQSRDAIKFKPRNGFPVHASPESALALELCDALLDLRADMRRVIDALAAKEAERIAADELEAA